jgi:hypothetical protein
MRSQAARRELKKTLSAIGLVSLVQGSDGLGLRVRGYEIPKVGNVDAANAAL